MKRSALLFLMLFPALAFGSIYVRQHSATIVNGKKILASDLNDEFDAIATSVNSIDSSNITDGTLTATDAAATSSLVTLNKKNGCEFYRVGDITGRKTVSISPPCEINMDGLRGFITATASITLLSNLNDGSLGAANYYYIYATRNSASLGFMFSQVQPNTTTARKADDTSARYIGTVRTGDATTDIVDFRRQGVSFFWNQDSAASALTLANQPSTGLTATLTAATSTVTFVVPRHFTALQYAYRMFSTGSSSQCAFNIEGTPGARPVTVATGGNIGVLPFWSFPSGGFSAGSANYGNFVNPGFSASVTDISNCWAGGDIRAIGWSEPPSLHQ